MRRILLLPFLLPLFAGCETLITDAATRLAYDLRDRARDLRRSPDARLTFEHPMRARPDGCAGNYRIRLNEREGQRGIGVTCDPRKPDWYHTTHHLNFVTVPADLAVEHRAGEPTRVTLEKRGDGIALIALE